MEPSYRISFYVCTADGTKKSGRYELLKEAVEVAQKAWGDVVVERHWEVFDKFEKRYVIDTSKDIPRMVVWP